MLCHAFCRPNPLDALTGEPPQPVPPYRSFDVTMPLPAACTATAASSHSVGLSLPLPLPPKPSLSAVYSTSLPCTCTAVLPASTVSSRRSSAIVDCDTEPSRSTAAATQSVQCGCRSFSSHQWIARKCRECSHDRSMHRMAGEEADEAEKAAEDANYAHVGSTIINSARGGGQPQPLQQREPPAPIITRSSGELDGPVGCGSIHDSSSGDTRNGRSHVEALSSHTAETLKKPPSPPTIVTSPLSGLSPRSPPPIGRSPPPPPSRRPPTSPSPRPAGAAFARTLAHSTPVTPLLSSAHAPTPPPLQPSTTAADNDSAAAPSHPPTVIASGGSGNSSGSIQPTLDRSITLAPIASRLLSSGASNGSGSSDISRPQSPASSGPSPTLSDYTSLHSLYTMQSALRCTAEAELVQCRAAIARLESASGSTESASATHIRSLLGSLAAAQKQVEAAQLSIKQNEADIGTLHDQLQQERQTRMTAEQALQRAIAESNEQIQLLQQQLQAAQRARVDALSHQQRDRAAVLEEKEAELTGAQEAREAQQKQVEDGESCAVQPTKWALPASVTAAAELTSSELSSQPPPPIPRRPEQPSSSMPPFPHPSPFSSAAVSLASPPSPYSSAPVEVRQSVASAADPRLTVSALPPPLTVESVLQFFHGCLRLGDSYLQYLSHFVEEALEQHSTHSAQIAAVTDIATEVEQNAYELLRKIGAGGFGEVYEGRRKRDGERVAVKVSRRTHPTQHSTAGCTHATREGRARTGTYLAACLTNNCSLLVCCAVVCRVVLLAAVCCQVIDLELSSEDVTTISQEVLSLSSTRLCAQLVSYYGCCVVHTSSLWLVMELVADGSLLHHLQLHGPFSEEAIAIVCKEVLLGLLYMANEGKIHRDIKAANILLNVQRCQVKLTDFGASRQLSDTLKKCNTLIGSPYWMAPEVLLRDDYDNKADIWSLGITLVELATGRPPHAHIPPMQVRLVQPRDLLSPSPPLLPRSPSRRTSPVCARVQVMQKIVEWPAPTLHGSSVHGREFSGPFCSFVVQCLQKDPSQRATLSALLRHDFIKKAKSTAKLRTIFADRIVGGKQR